MVSCQFFEKQVPDEKELLEQELIMQLKLNNYDNKRTTNNRQLI